MKPQLWIYAAAGYNVALAAFHLGFWRLFRWREELPKLHPVNRGVLPVLNFMLTFIFLLMAGLEVLLAEEMTGTALGRALLAGMMFFWILRAGLQLVFWPAAPRMVNGAFAFLFLVGAGLHALAFQPK
ncbi:MAG: hypothetical protein PSV13_11405 [Lacunisphaera sp.]|nr:hypothetical protein [Lacunisphaera sp.]